MFDVLAASAPAPGGSNEDYFLVAGNWALVLDGVSPYPSMDVGCRHDVPWFVARLGNHFGAGMTRQRSSSLAELLADAIRQTATDHGPGCDLSNPLTLAATVAAVRVNSGAIEWLVLGDTTIVWKFADGQIRAVSDDRLANLSGGPIVESGVRRYEPEYVAKVRNTPGGFWVASTDPAAAFESLNGKFPESSTVRIGLYSDGVTRLVERYGYSWADCFDAADSNGITSLITAVRESESLDPDPGRWRGKQHDDATAVIIRWAAS